MLDNGSCPLCRANLETFDPSTAPRNNTIAGLVESVKQQGIAPIIAPKRHEWTCNIKQLSTVDGGIAELTLLIKDSKFEVRPSLFIAVVDNR